MKPATIARKLFVAVDWKARQESVMLNGMRARRLDGGGTRTASITGGVVALADALAEAFGG